MKVMTFPILSDGDSQLNKKGINRQIAVESNGKHKIFQNQEALVNLSLKTTIQQTIKSNNKTPSVKNHFLFASMNAA